MHGRIVGGKLPSARLRSGRVRLYYNLSFIAAHIPSLEERPVNKIGRDPFNLPGYGLGECVPGMKEGEQDGSVSVNERHIGAFFDLVEPDFRCLRQVPFAQPKHPLFRTIPDRNFVCLEPAAHQVCRFAKSGKFPRARPGLNLTSPFVKRFGCDIGHARR